MRTILKTLLYTLIAATALATAVATASANNLSVTNQNIRATWSALEFSGGGVSVRCAVTLEGRFHEVTIRKVRGSLIGAITRAIVRHPCTGGTMWAHSGEPNEVLGGTFASTLPWHLTYEGFEGRLPAISSIIVLLTRATFTIRATLFGITLLCDYLTSETRNMRGRITVGAGGDTSTIAASTDSISSTSGGACPSIAFAGTGNVMLLGNTTHISVRLI
jgi:hypothetical protein